MALDVPHEQVRETEDRSWTSALLDEVRSMSTSEAERGEALCTLASLEDHRSIGPLTAMVEDDQLRESVREAASAVLLGFDDSTTGERRRRWWESGDPVKMAHALPSMERSEADVVVTVAGDGTHRLQKLALSGMTFGFDEAEYQPVKIRALVHRDADVREAAASVLLWDEPVAAEKPLLSAASDPSGDVAAAAIDTLQYYPSRRVLRALAELAEAEDDQVRATATESFGSMRSRFECVAASGDPEQVARLRDWMKPVADLVRWPEKVRDRGVFSPRADRFGVTVSESELLAMLLDPDGEWAPKKRTLREVAWERYAAGERGRLCKALTTHADPVVREAATVPLVAWGRSEELLGLSSDPSSSVRKSAMYRLGLVPRDPAFAVFAWEYMLGAGGTTAYESLRTYVAHASAGEARERLTELARTDRRESIRTSAISCLVDLGGVRELVSLASLLSEPPGVTWAVHIELLDGFRTLGLLVPGLDDLAAADNLDLEQSVVALRCASRR